MNETTLQERRPPLRRTRTAELLEMGKREIAQGPVRIRRVFREAIERESWNGAPESKALACVLSPSRKPVLLHFPRYCPDPRQGREYIVERPCKSGRAHLARGS